MIDTVKCTNTILPLNEASNVYYLWFRFSCALYAVVLLLWCFVRYSSIYHSWIGWCFYTSDWTTLMITGYFICITILHFHIHAELNINSYLFKVTIFFLNLSISWSFCLIITYWIILYQPNISILDFNKHVIAPLLILVEWFISAWDLPYSGYSLSVVFGILQLGLSLIFNVFDWKNEINNNNNNKKYIDSQINWNGNVGIVILLCILKLFGYFISHILLVFIKNKLLNYKSSRNETQQINERVPLVTVE